MFQFRMQWYSYWKSNMYIWSLCGTVSTLLTISQRWHYLCPQWCKVIKNKVNKAFTLLYYNHWSQSSKPLNCVYKFMYIHFSHASVKVNEMSLDEFKGYLEDSKCISSRLILLLRWLKAGRSFCVPLEPFFRGHNIMVVIWQNIV